MPVSRRASVIVAATLTTWLAATGIAYAFLPKPANAVELFTTIDGRHINQHALHGKIVLINFWATTCIICRAEMPELISVYRQYQSRGLEIIAVAMPYDNLPAVRQAVTSQALPFPVVYDREGYSCAITARSKSRRSQPYWTNRAGESRKPLASSILRSCVLFWMRHLPRRLLDVPA